MYDATIDRLVSQLPEWEQQRWNHDRYMGHKPTTRCAVCQCSLVGNQMGTLQVTVEAGQLIALAHICTSHYCQSKVRISLGVTSDHDVQVSACLPEAMSAHRHGLIQAAYGAWLRRVCEQPDDGSEIPG